MRRKVNVFAIVVLALSLVNVAIQYLSDHSIQSQLFNSDALYLPTLLSDIFSKGGRITDWFLTPAPYFFPDCLVFLFAYLVGSGSYSQIIAFALTQIALTFLLVWFLVKETTVGGHFFTASTILVALIWLALNSGEPFSLALNSAFHYGIFLVAILMTALWNKCGRESEKSRRMAFYTLMTFLAFASTLSDNLFLVQVVAPLFATQVLISLSKRDLSFKSMLPLMFVIILGVLGSVSYKWVVTNNTRYPVNIGTHKLSANLKEIYELFCATIISRPVLLVFLIYLCVVLYSFALLVRGARKIPPSSWLAIFSFLSSCTTLCAVLLVTNLPVTSRYLIPALFWPVIVAFIFLNNFLREYFTPAAIVVALVALASMSWDSYQFFRINAIQTQYYPEDVSCIDDFLEKENLNSGIAQYWDAKYIQNFSRLNLNLAQHFGNLREMYWVTSKEYFKENYDFAIISEEANPPYKISSEALVRLNGPPKLVKACGSRSVYVYGRGKMRVRRIVNVGDSYLWNACELPTIIGERTADCRMQKMDGIQSGYVTFGPYEKLPVGHYTFEIAYSSIVSKGGIAGDWDVVLHLPKNEQVLNKGLIAGSGGADDKVVGKFALDFEQNMGEIEVRTLARSNVDLKIIYIRVDRVQ